MKPARCIYICLMLLTLPLMANQSNEIQALQAIRDAGELAFERNDINTIEKLWLHDDDVLMTTPIGTRHKGFAEIKGALIDLFGLLGQTTIDVSEPFLTVDGNEASITMTYRWSPAPDIRFPLTERYRKVDRDWKIYVSDSQGHFSPLRPEDEAVIKPLLLAVQRGLLAKDTAAIENLVAADFIYTNFNGTRHRGWLASVEMLRADIKQIANLQLESTTLMGNQACTSVLLTLTDDKIRNVQFTFAGPDWQLATINLNPEAESRTVMPRNKTATLWGLLKAERER